MRHADDRLGVDPARAVVAAVVEDVFHAAEEMHFLGVLGADNLPGIAEDVPAVRMLDLETVDKFLTEQAVLVVDAVAERRVVQRRERIEEARREAAEAAVA